MNANFTVIRLSLVRERDVEYVKTCRTSDDVYNAAKAIGYENYAEEYFGMFCLSTNGNIISYHEISHGDLNSSIVAPREVFKRAILNNASAVIFVHNHPSGDIMPSSDDKTTTERLCKAGEILGIQVLDHVIIGNGNYYSMKSNNEF